MPREGSCYCAGHCCKRLTTGIPRSASPRQPLVPRRSPDNDYSSRITEANATHHRHPYHTTPLLPPRRRRKASEQRCGDLWMR